MKKIRIYSWILFVFCFMACSGSDEVGEIVPWTDEYELPQGKSNADDRIMAYHDLYGTYILYEYTDWDYRYELTNSYNFKLPDPIYVGDMLDLLEDIWFDFYPVDFHKKYMPLKIMLAEYLEYEDIWMETSTFYFVLTRNSSAIGIGFCSDTLRKITSQTKLEFKNNLQRNLWYDWLTRIDFPDEFFEISDYSCAAVLDDSSSDYTRSRGFVADYYNDYYNEWSTKVDWQTRLLNKQTDLRSFIMGMIVRSTADWKDDLEWPLVKQKYDILRDWIQKEYGFDIQEIGNVVYD